jgi:hypothetical protein
MLEDFICSAGSAEGSLALLSKVSAPPPPIVLRLNCSQVCQMLTLSPGTVYELANVPTRVEEFMSDNGLIRQAHAWRSSARASRRAADRPLQGEPRFT